MRKSSRGNPWHDAKGRFCHGPTATTDTWGNEISDEQRQEAAKFSEKSEHEYTARTNARIAEREQAERNSAFAAIINGNPTDSDIDVLNKESEYQEELLRKYYLNQERIPDKEIERRNAFRIVAMAYMKANGEETITKYADGDAWNVSRMALQSAIVNEYKSKDVPHEGKCLISGGLGGAGKSTVLRDCLGIDENSYITVNADDIKEIMAERNMIPTFKGLTPMECSELVHEEASFLSKEILGDLTESKANVILDITMSSYGSVEKRCKLLKSRGYSSIQPVFVDISPETSKERAVRRYSRGMEKYTVKHKGCGGRPLPGHVISSNLTEGAYRSKNAETLVALANDGLFTETPIVYDNEGSGPVKVDWARFVK